MIIKIIFIYIEYYKLNFFFNNLHNFIFSYCYIINNMKKKSNLIDILYIIMYETFIHFTDLFFISYYYILNK